MRPFARALRVVAPALLGALLIGCAPEVGSDRWCKKLDTQAKGDWSVNDAANYTKHCVLGLKPSR